MVAEGISPSSFAAITFTTRAAHELAERLGGVRLGFAGTIHSFAWSLLELGAGLEGGLAKGFSLWDEVDCRDVMGSIVKQGGAPVGATEVLNWLDEIHHAGRDPALDMTPACRREAAILKVARSFRAAKAAANVEDYNGLIDRARLLLLQNPGFLRQMQERFRHGCVDEYQDVDRSQDDLVRLIWPDDILTPMHGRSLFLIGDPVQSLYRWRGADPELMDDHAQRAHNIEYLDVNFRSEPGIVSTCNLLRAKDPAGQPSALKANRAKDIYPAVRVVMHLDDVAEDRWIAEKLVEALRAGEPGSDYAVLCRTNHRLRLLAETLDAHNVAYNLVGAHADKMRGPLVRGALAYLRLAVNEADDRAFETALLVMPRPNLTSVFWDALRERAGGSYLFPTVRALLENPEEAVTFGPWLNELDGFVMQVDNLKGRNWLYYANEIFDWLQVCAMEAGLSSRAEQMAHLTEMTLKYDAATLFEYSPRSFLRWILLRQSADDVDPDLNLPTLSTMHLAKGLEWRHVFVPDCCEGVLPSQRSLNAAQAGPLGYDSGPVVDERRVMFVAASRAMDSLTVSFPSVTTRAPFPTHDGREYADIRSPSRFLIEMGYKERGPGAWTLA